MQNILTRRLCAALATGLLAASLVPSAALAGAHGGPPKAADLLVDPTKRSDVTGTVLITGSNRGIGLAMAKNYAARGWTVIATARSPGKADELKALAKQYPDTVSVERLDVTDPGEIEALAKKYEGQAIDVLLNNAAMLGDPQGQVLGNYDFDLFLRIMNTNVAGPLRVSQAFVDHVARSDMKKIVAITSTQGSLTFIRMPGLQFYNSSKSALNMVMKGLSAAVEERGVTVALVSPGAVDTDMMDLALGGRSFPGGLITAEESAEAVINIIDQYGPELGIVFMSHEGARLPW